MTPTMQIQPLPPGRRRNRPQDPAQLGFGRFYSDHMFTLRWSAAQGWHDARLGPHESLVLSPAAMVLHYGQAVFEGLKAYRNPRGTINLFRPEENAARLDGSARRLALPALPPGAFVEAVQALVALDHEWVPEAPGTSLYLRPTMIAVEPHLGVRPAQEVLFFVIAGPVGAYYAEGFAPVRIAVEERYVRAAPGGLGGVKAGANYAASLLAGVEAQAAGFSQVLWLDAVHRRFIEEVGSSNILFQIDGTVVCPPTGDTTLAGVTLRSVLELLRSWGVPVAERPLAIDEVLQAHAAGRLQEAFGTGTAAVISPVGQLHYQGRSVEIAGGRTGPLAQRLYEELTGIQYGRRPDPFGWVHEVAPRLEAAPLPAAG
jgi:branched-chain amino acid aminotransferase